MTRTTQKNVIDSRPRDYISFIDDLLRPSPTQKPLVLDLFAGCGGLSLGFEAQGFATLGLEKEEDYCATYRENLHGECIPVNLTKDYSFPDAPVIIGGPPCQPFSVGGKQLGLDDSRDGFPIFISAVEDIRPKIFLFENVRGMLYRNKWYLKEVVQRLRDLGYLVQYKLFNFVNYGVPQKRQRLMVVGHKGGYSFPKPVKYKLTAGDALQEMSTSIPPESTFLTPSQDKYIAKYEKASKCVTPRDLHLDKPSRTVTCRNLAGATGDMMRLRLPDGRRRRLLPREAARIQSFPDWFKFKGSITSQFNQIGNAVSPLFAYQMASSIRAYLDSGDRISRREIEDYNHRLSPAKQLRIPLESKDNMESNSHSENQNNSKHRDTLDTDTIKYVLTKEESIEKGVTGRSWHTFDSKPDEIRKTINQALHILDMLGIPVEKQSPRQKEKTALAFMSVCDVKSSYEWKHAKSLDEGRAPTTREIIDYFNTQFGEDMSRGSYDDIRRKSLRHVIMANIVMTGDPESAKNSGVRGWGLNPDYKNLVRGYGRDDWSNNVDEFLSEIETLRERMSAKREMATIPVVLPAGNTLNFGPGEHNTLQKQVIEEFLPRYGYGCRVLYVGDAGDKFLHHDKRGLREVGLPELSHDELPDIVAYSSQKDWVYLIEAVHSSNPISSERKINLENFAEKCLAEGIIYVTAFLDRETFRSFVADIAWETEVWISEDPDHLIHFDGEKFLGPFSADSS